MDTERAYWTGMSRHLKDELKVKSLISGTQLGYSPPHVQAELDYIDNHSYWCHPSPVTKDWRIHFPACAALFLRGDVREAQSAVIAAADYPAYFDRLVASKSVSASIGSAGFESRLTLLHKTAVDLTGMQEPEPSAVAMPEGKELVSDTGELTLNTEMPEAGYWTVDTPNTKLFTGFPKGRTIKLGGVTLTIGKTRLDWATISLVSRRATGFGESGGPSNILLAATGVAENKGMVIEQVNAQQITLADKWGMDRSASKASRPPSRCPPIRPKQNALRSIRAGTGSRAFPSKRMMAEVPESF